MKRTTKLWALLLSLVFCALPLFSCTDTTPPSTWVPPEDDGTDKSDLYSYTPVITEKLPEIHITTADKENTWATRYKRQDKLMGQIEYTSALIDVTDCEEEYRIKEAEAEVKVRGNYTLDYDKKPIRIKFKEKNGMLGLHDEEAYKNWVLLADWKDPSLMRNALTLYLGNAILGSDGFYTSDFRTVEVYLNGEYWGLYLLVEQQEVKDGRTSVPEVDKGYEGTDIGYFFEYDGYYMYERQLPDGDPTFEMKNGAGRNGQRGYTVKSDIYSDGQIDFLRNYMDNLYTIVYRANYQGRYFKFNEDKTDIVRDPDCQSAKEAVSNVVDIRSLVDTYIINELACDLDVDFSSFYLSLDMTADGAQKLIFEAPWDFDSAYGIWVGMCNDSVGMYAMERGNPWFDLFEGVEWFESMVKDKWNEIKKHGVLDNALSFIQTQKTAYATYYAQNHQRWQKRLTEGHGSLIPQLATFSNYQTAQGIAADHLYDWLSRRIAYLDGQWSKK